MRKLLIISAVFCCSNLFAQKFIQKQINSDSVAKYENELESILEERNGDMTIMLSPSLYPMVAEKNLGQPYTYERKLSDFRVPAICEYYFDLSGNTLWYTMISWRATNGINIFDFEAQDKKLIAEISHKDEYMIFYKKINDMVTEKFGEPYSRSNNLVNLGENSIGEKVTWESEEIKIVSEIQMPKGNELEFLRVTLTTYWK